MSGCQQRVPHSASPANAESAEASAAAADRGPDGAEPGYREALQSGQEGGRDAPLQETRGLETSWSGGGSEELHCCPRPEGGHGGKGGTGGVAAPAGNRGEQLGEPGQGGGG